MNDPAGIRTIVEIQEVLDLIDRWREAHQDDSITARLAVKKLRSWLKYALELPRE